MEPTQEERIELLQNWAQRLLSQPAPATAVDRRQHPRVQENSKITLIPLEPQSLRPLMDSKVVAVTKDQSTTGVGILTDAILPGETFFAELEGTTQILLLRRVRKRKVKGDVLEYGMQILDSYGSFEELQGA